MFKLVTHGAGPVLTPGASYEQTWYRFTRRCYIPNIKALSLPVSESKIFEVFLPCSYVLTCEPPSPGAGPVLTPGDHLNKLGRGSLGDATHQISKLYVI